METEMVERVIQGSALSVFDLRNHLPPDSKMQALLLSLKATGGSLTKTESKQLTHLNPEEVINAA